MMMLGLTYLNKKHLSAIASLLLFALLPTRLAAQTPVSFATQQATVMNAVTAAGTTPTGSGATPCNPPVAAGSSCQVPAFGQGYHIVYWTTTGSVTQVRVRIEGSNDGANWFALSSDSAVPVSTTANTGMTYGYGTVAAVRVNLVTFAHSAGATFTAVYSGAPGFGNLQGGFNQGQNYTAIAWSAAALPNNAATGVFLNTPFASSYAQVQYTISGETANSTLTFTAIDQGGDATILGIITLSGSLSTQFNLPAVPTSQIEVSFSSPSGTGNATVSVSLIFAPPPLVSGYNATNITTDTAIILKTANTDTFLHSITVNTAGATSAITVSINSGVSSGNCSGGTLIATVDTTALRQIFFDVDAQAGICVKTTGGTPADITVTYR
jgi:hypothetical protein